MKRIPVFFTLLLAALAPASAQRSPQPRLIPPPPPRIELADTNASPMQVREMSVAATVRGLYATVETTLVFHNPNPRLLEGELVFPLPDGAAVCGYALDLNGVLVDGVVVKKEKARVAFEAETRRRVDPGLVEHVKGNLYRTRIYPLPANGARTVRLSYVAPLAISSDADVALLLPMPRETIEKLAVKIEVANDAAEPPVLGGLGDRRFEWAENFWRVESVATNVAPDEDVWVALPGLACPVNALEKSPDGSVWFSLAITAPSSISRFFQRPSTFTVLWDASGSRVGKDLQKEYDLLAALEGTRFELVVFRDVPEAPRTFETADELVAALKDLPYDGGTDFAALAAALGAEDANVRLLFTDGLDTLSDRPMEFPGPAPIAVVSDTIADRESLRQACAGLVVDLQTTDVKSAAQVILAPPSRIVGVQGTGIANVQGIGRPFSVGLAPLLGQLLADEATLRIEFSTCGQRELSEPIVLRAEKARAGKTLATAWAAARVTQLSPRAETFEEELLALGRQYGLVSPATSLIVLESLDQWVRHEIEPPASLPEMREQYFAALKNRGQDEGDARARHLEQLAELWKQRVDWWKRDYEKNPLPASSGKDRERGGSGALFAMAADREELAQAPLPAPPMEVAEADAFMMMGGEAEPVQKQSGPAEPPASSIQIKEWSPDVPYLNRIRKAEAAGRYAAYLAERKDWSGSPAFFLDGAGEFLKQDKPLGRRILSNLAELKIEDAALLRVYAWRLQQAGDLDRAIVLLRRVAKLRAEEPQSFRDLALALADRGVAAKDKADLEEAMELFLKVALTPWNRHADSIPLFALEEFNALAAWIERQKWPEGGKPAVPSVEKKFRKNLDVDVRIVMSWDADATDIDLHVVEPGGEEAFYGHNRTARGGLVSRDVTDGYGPEEYLIRRAPRGKYGLKAKYYGSRQQTVVGPATVTATVFTDWGRAAEQRQTLTLRLDQPREMVDIGAIVFGGGDAGAIAPPADFADLRPGMAKAEVEAAVGPPNPGGDGRAWRYEIGARVLLIHFDGEDKLARVVEILPGGVENILVQ